MFCIKKKYECCLDIWEGRIVWIRGPFEPATHDISVFRGGEKEVKKEDWDRNALYFQVKEGDLMLEIADMLVNRARLLYGGMSTLLNTRNFWQELPAVRRQFSRGSRTGKFSSTVLLMETQLKKG